MGYGDEIMVTGEARRCQGAGDARPVAVLDRHGQPRRHPLWAGNPRIATPEAVARGLPVQTIVNGPGCRPYIDYGRTTETRWAYRDWRATPGELYGIEARKPRDYAIVEPHVKAKASPNKDWGWARWQALVRRLDLDWVQLGPPGTRLLDGVRTIETASFLAACRALTGARAAVLPEGGLHHAAAALGVPAVVIFGAMTSPANTGYDSHTNLFDAGSASPCGRRVACPHCARAMARIEPETVATYLEQLL
ncbi:MAG: hypothetical protein IIC53_05680 [Proteobacteria bacterium]|nr:hypothetical protein [Pseudomonadota bacterium]